MIKVEKESIEQTTRGLDGYLLFDKLAGYYKSWFAFKQNPNYQDLKQQSQKLADEWHQIPFKVQTLEQPLVGEAQQLFPQFKQALYEQGQAVDLYRRRNIRSFLYNLSSIFSLSLAEKIIPYVKSQVDFRLTRALLQEKEAEISDVRRDGGLELLSLKTQKLTIDSKLRILEREWVLSSRDRTLFYALINLTHQSEARDALFMEGAKRLGIDVLDVRQSYTQIVSRARPYLSTDEVASNKADMESAEDGQDEIGLEELEPIAKGYMNNHRHQESVDTCTDEALKQVPKRKILIDINGKPIFFDELSEGDFEDIVRKSGTPLSVDQIKEIAGNLSDTQDPLKEYQRYPFTVQLGEYKGFHVVKKGKKGRVLFKFYDDTLHVRFGDYYKVYADTHKWKG